MRRVVCGARFLPRGKCSEALPDSDRFEAASCVSSKTAWLHRACRVPSVWLRAGLHESPIAFAQEATPCHDGACVLAQTWAEGRS